MRKYQAFVGRDLYTMWYVTQGLNKVLLNINIIELEITIQNQGGNDK